MSSRISNLIGNGIEENLDPELKRSFDFDDGKVDPKLKDPQKIKLEEGVFRLSGDGIFYTIQGEGKTMGLPVVFLRLHVCNLRCVWCDAWYTWNPNTPQFWTESNTKTIPEMKKAIEKEWGCKNPEVKKRIVITGGEPLLQKTQIDDLMLEMKDWTFEIETNGTVMPTDLQLKFVQFNCSPKLRNSQNVEAARKKPEVIKALNKVDTQYKFVVMHNDDLDEIEKEWIEAYEIPIDKVILMPQGVTSEEVRKNAQQLVEYAKVKGYRLMDRLQVDIWGARRRV